MVLVLDKLGCSHILDTKLRKDAFGTGGKQGCKLSRFHIMRCLYKTRGHTPDSAPRTVDGYASSAPTVCAAECFFNCNLDAEHRGYCNRELA